MYLFSEGQISRLLHAATKEVAATSSYTKQNSPHVRLKAESRCSDIEIYNDHDENRTHSIGWISPCIVRPRSLNQSRACIVLTMHSRYGGLCDRAFNLSGDLKAVDTIGKIIISIKPYLVTSNGERLMV